MSHRKFVQFDTETGNIFSVLESEHPPGDIAATPEEETVPDDVREITDEPHRPDGEWFRYKWTGSEFVERDDIPEPENTPSTEDRLSSIEEMLQQLIDGQG